MEQLQLLSPDPEDFRQRHCINWGCQRLHCVGLAEVRKRSSWHGPLTPWPAVIHAMRCYYGEPEDAECVEVQHLLVFQKPVEIFTVRAEGVRTKWKAIADSQQERPWANAGGIKAGYMLRPSWPEGR